MNMVNDFVYVYENKIRKPVEIVFRKQEGE
jgi:hypothetical protein